MKSKLRMCHVPIFVLNTDQYLSDSQQTLFIRMAWKQYQRCPVLPAGVKAVLKITKTSQHPPWMNQTEAFMLSERFLVPPRIHTTYILSQRASSCLDDPLHISGFSLHVPSNTGSLAVQKSFRIPPSYSTCPMLFGGTLGSLHVLSEQHGGPRVRRHEGRISECFRR